MTEDKDERRDSILSREANLVWMRLHMLLVKGWGAAQTLGPISVSANGAQAPSPSDSHGNILKTMEHWDRPWTASLSWHQTRKWILCESLLDVQELSHEILGNWDSWWHLSIDMVPIHFHWSSPNLDQAWCWKIIVSWKSKVDYIHHQEN